MKRKIMLVALVICMALYAPAAFAWETPVNSAAGRGFVTTNFPQDQLVFDQKNHEAGFVKSDVDTFQVDKSGYNAFHNGPGFDGKGFDASTFKVTTSNVDKSAFYSMDARSQGMSQATTSALNAGAGSTAQGFAGTDTSAVGAVGGVQAQVVSYNPAPGMNGGGIQISGGVSAVSVNTHAGF